MTEARSELADLKSHLVQMQAEFSSQIATFQQLVVSGLEAQKQQESQLASEPAPKSSSAKETAS